MNACPDILEALPGVLAGEPDDAGVHAHLALCATCRGEADALVTDLERVREGLGALGRRGTRRADAYARPARTRTIGWLPVAAGLVALVIGGFWLGQHLRDESGPATPVAAAPVGSEHGFRSVATLLARRDVPRVLQVRMAADGTLRLRAYRVGSTSSPEVRGPWHLGAEGDPEASVAALRALGQALEGAARPTAPPAPAPDDAPTAPSPGEPSVSIKRVEDARLVIDAEDGVGWRNVQWVLAVGSSQTLRRWRITFLAPPHGAALDLDLPRDPLLKDWVADDPPHENLPAVKLFRKEGAPSPAADFTRVRLGDEQTWDLPPAYGEGTEVALGALKNMLASAHQAGCVRQAAAHRGEGPAAHGWPRPHRRRAARARCHPPRRHRGHPAGGHGAARRVPGELAFALSGPEVAAAFC